MALFETQTAASDAPITNYEPGWRMALRQLMRNKAAFAGLLCLMAIVVVALFAPWILPFDPVTISLSEKLQGPGLVHWLGTDHFGRDVFARMVYGARVSLTVGLSTVLFATVFGLPIGLISGYVGGHLDNILMRVMDAFLTFPPLLLGVAVVGLLGADLGTVTLALGIVQIPVLARVVRSSTLSVREETYITSTRALGAGPWRIVLRHVLRNILSPLVVQITIIFSAAIVAEASLSFLGLGVQPPAPSWGRDLSEARRYMVDAPWLFISPTAFIIISVMTINFMGDGLRDALDPRSWTRHSEKTKGMGDASADS
jgi:peptide/nickel transport system permease protein